MWAVMGQIFALSLTAAVNPTLVAATTVMLILPSPKRLMLGYLLGALLTSLTLGLVIVFALKNSGAVHTTKRTLSPAVDIALGLIALVLAYVIGTARDRQLAERRRKGKTDTGPPRWQKALSKGSARTTLVVGAALSLPGASYLAGLDLITKQKDSTVEIVALVLGFNLIMLALLEVPLISFAVAPNWTPDAVARAKQWIGRRGRRIAVWGLMALGAALVIKGLTLLLS